MFRHLTSLALLVAVALAPAISTSQASAQAAGRPSPDGIGIRLVDVPIVTRADPRARRYIVDHLKPGMVIDRRIEVSNTTDDRLRVAVYPAAASISNGKFTFADGHISNELSTWTSVAPRELTLAPHSSSMATVAVTVPDKASAGERYAVVWAEVTTIAPPGGVNEVNRVGVRIYLSVGPGGAPPTDFTIDTLTTQRTADGKPMVLAQVHNTGGRALDLTGDLRLSEGPGGMSAGPFDVQLGTTLPPGGIGTATVPLSDQVPDGPWKARIRLQSGLVKRVAQATIRFPSSAGLAAAVPTEADLLPVAITAGLVLTATGLTVALLRRGRRVAQAGP
ncbi:peptidase [Streptosporangium sp. 'caverna']|uniref:peptidase n=1 Tax=Streptosporangium sp. 'caverna' TaxID=2202249 RepID=UPI001955056E|nr:peptidase [Streptosporangium sp. 'caverna']